MSESTEALCCATLSSGRGGLPPCDQTLAGTVATAIRLNATNESDEVARVSNTESKRRISLCTLSAGIQDFVHSSLDVIQSETHWSEVNCLGVIRAGEQQPGLEERCAG